MIRNRGRKPFVGEDASAYDQSESLHRSEAAYFI